MKTIDKILQLIICSAYGLMIGLTFVGVLCRYFFNFSIVWGEELSRYLFVWIVFLAAPIGVEKGVHISVDFFSRLFSEKTKRTLTVVHIILLVAFLVVVFVPSWTVIKMGMKNLSLANGIPMGIVYLAFTVGWILIVSYQIRATILIITKEKTCGRS